MVKHIDPSAISRRRGVFLCGPRPGHGAAPRVGCGFQRGAGFGSDKFYRSVNSSRALFTHFALCVIMNANTLSLHAAARALEISASGVGQFEQDPVLFYSNQGKGDFPTCIHILTSRAVLPPPISPAGREHRERPRGGPIPTGRSCSGHRPRSSASCAAAAHGRAGPCWLPS